MGLMDRDYMRDERRQRRFGPPPRHSGTSTLAMALIFLAVLFGVYTIADWKLKQRADAVIAPSPATEKVFIPNNSSKPKTFIPPSSSRGTPDASSGTQLVTKCVTNGKTSYGDGSCALGSVASQVMTRSNHNLMAPVRPDPVALAATEARISPRTVVTQDPPVVYAAAAKKAECDFLDVQIKQFDARSRLPQAPQMQDWIRDERKKARDQQFRLSCG